MNATPATSSHHTPTSLTGARWRPASIALIVLAWLLLHIGCLFSPGLLDDVDSVYIEIARQMLVRHDLVTPYIDGIRFFDKPPLMFWLAAGSMHLFGATDWAARLPLALLTLALFLATYALGLRLLANLSPTHTPDRAALYAALALATSIGPFLYTRFFIPDIAVTLWLTLSIHLFLIATDRASTAPLSSHPPQKSSSRPERSAVERPPYFAPAELNAATPTGVPGERSSLAGVERSGGTHLPASNPQNPSSRPKASQSEAAVERPLYFAPARIPIPPSKAQRLLETVISTEQREWRDPFGQKATSVSPPQEATHSPERQPTALLPMLGFAATLAASLLTKGFIGLVFPLGFALLYLALTRQLPLLRRLHLPAATALFLALALPWHLLIARRNPAIPLPAGLGLPATAGWAWFYLYNEHIARFLSRRIPHDYGQVPIPLFWLLAAVWLLPWVAFLPAALTERLRNLRHAASDPRSRQTTLALILWIALVLGFFTLSARQEYYSLPALPACAFLIGGLLARADRSQATAKTSPGTLTPQPTPSDSDSEDLRARHAALAWSRWLLLPLGTVLALACATFALIAPAVPPGTDIADLLHRSSDSYNLSLSHLSDLTPAAMGLFRRPLALCALAMLVIGPVCTLLRRSGRTFTANLTLAAAGSVLLLSIHAGLARFYPILGSKPLAESILLNQQQNQHQPDPDPGLILIDGELTSGSSLLFYTRQPAHLINGRINGPWFGSFWPDAPPIFDTDATLRQLWTSPRRLYLLTSTPATRLADLSRLAPTRILSTSGGKAILTNQP